MSSDDTPDAPETPAVTDRREAVREKALQVHSRQSRARIARRSGLGVLAVGIVAAAAVAVTWTVSSAGSKPQLEPATASGDGFVVADVVNTSVSTDIAAQTDASAPAEAAPDAAAATPAEGLPAPTSTATPPVEIRVYVDYLSAGAREWQVANAQQLTSWVDDGAVTLSYYPVAMLTAKSNGTKYSLRAASAAACVATNAPDAFFAFNNELLTRQPEVDTDGYSDTELANMAQASGVDSTRVVRDCIESGSYAAWAKSATERAVAGIPDTNGLSLTGTPMVLVNGKQYIGDLSDPAEFSQFVLTTASDAYYKSAPTPTPTPTEAPAS
ncbi:MULTISPECIES: DsbA family protein [Microbacterium]|uniref:DsbA family protein n=1 Tax=Microbacterium TaxID=33882 RepID=UPI000E770409|nr:MULTISPECIES: thioredoxin domain-containing protein [Microbacterium]RKE60425.1 protein-disulfide isomerase [Microbacterium sp. AG238]WJM14702.1 thioredoxin domain-containing protein [Microbacterium arborescens]